MAARVALRPYQEEGVSDIRAAFKRKNYPTLFVLPTGGGKCLGAGTPVLMFDGSIKLVEDIRVGDQLMGPDRKPRQVLSLARGREQMYRVRNHAKGYVVNESHILSLRHQGAGELRNVSVHDYMKWPPVNRVQWGGWHVPGVLRGDLRTRLHTIAVEPIGEGDYFGFEIDGDHLFMLGDFTVTHNTYTFCYIASNAAEKGNNVVIIVHRKELLLQASKSLNAIGIDHGLISPHFTASPHKMIQVASIDTLLIRVKKWPEKYRFKLAIYDEAHHVTKENKWGKLHKLLGEPITLGVTATPRRGDGTGLGVGHGGIFKEMVIGPLISDLIDMGMLVKPTVYTCLNPPDTSGLKTNAEGEYNAADAEALVDKPVIIGNAVDHYTEICPGAPAIVFCASIKHARHVVEQFNAAGYRFSLLVGEPTMSDGERTEVNRKLAAGELDGACTVALVDEGYDLPLLRCCIGLAPTASLSRYLQRVGRIMRLEDGKSSENTFYLDHVGDVGRVVDGIWKPKHGSPWAHRNWNLEGRKKGAKKAVEDEVKMMQCPKCYHVFDPAPACPKCKHDMTAVARKIEQAEGQLGRMEEEAEAAAQADAAAKAAAKIAQGKAQTVDQLMKALGCKRERALIILKARQEKAKLYEELRADLVAWQTETGQTTMDVFGMMLADLRKAKPAALKSLRERFDQYRREQSTGRAVDVFRTVAGVIKDQPGDDPQFGDWLRDTLSQPEESNKEFQF